MSMYLEYDKTNGKIIRVLTADNLPNNVAYLAYQEIPEGVEVNTSLNINEAIQIIIDHKNNQKIISQQNIDNESPEIIEV